MAEYLDTALAIAFQDELGQIKATPYFEDFLQRVVVATGGEGSDAATTIESIQTNADTIPYLRGLILSQRKRIEDLEVSIKDYVLQAQVKQLQIDTARFDTKIKTADYTAKNKDYVEARNGVTIKFPANAVSGDEVIFANGDGSTITFDGNGNNIKYTSTDTKFKTRNKGTSIHFHFFVDNALDESYWRAR